MSITVKMRLLPHAGDLVLPNPDQSDHALDLAAAIPIPMPIAPGHRALIPTGLIIDLPPGTEAQIRSRIGLVVRHGVTVLNPPLDAGYRGEVHVILINFGEWPFTVERGTVIARLVVAPVAMVKIEWPPE